MAKSFMRQRRARAEQVRCRRWSGGIVRAERKRNDRLTRRMPSKDPGRPFFSTRSAKQNRARKKERSGRKRLRLRQPKRRLFQKPERKLSSSTIPKCC